MTFLRIFKQNYLFSNTVLEYCSITTTKRKTPVKIIALSSSIIASLPCLHYLQNSGMLSAIVYPDRKHREIEDLMAWALHQKIKAVCLSEERIASGLKDLIIETEADLVIACAFPYRIPADLLTIPSKGFLNIHFSRLPQYRGPSPVFWQIKNGEKLTGITIHRMDSGWDTGAVIRMLEVPIYPGETTGICTARLSQLTVGLLKEVLDQGLTAIGQHPELASTYQKRPVINDMRIDWETYTASTIEQLVNACNPTGDGALSTYRQQVLQLLEVSPVDAMGNPGIAGGTVIHVDGNGLFVQCSDQKILRVNILKLREGILTGFKFAALGVKAGDIFENYNYN
jgi:methionyl-tRNA formyltransferase